MSEKLEYLIIGALIHNTDYNSKVFPHLHSELFEYPSTKSIFEIIKSYKDNFKDTPTLDTLSIELENKKGLSESIFQESSELLPKLYSEKTAEGIQKQNLEWLLKTSEKYLRNRACTNAIITGVSILDGENKKLTIDAIPELMKEALSISFENNIGHDYFSDAENRYERMHSKLKQIPFKLIMLNFITDGGIPTKSLIVPLASYGVGKSMFMVDWTAWLIKNGYNVLYVTLELSEEYIGNRIDVNFLDSNFKDLKNTSKTSFLTSLNTLKTNKVGNLIIKYQSPGTFTAVNLRTLLDDLKNKSGFVPEVVMVDYLGLMASATADKSANSFEKFKKVAEELRSVASDYDTVIVAPMQLNREGCIAESRGVANTADMMFKLMQDDDMAKLNHMRIVQDKNRFGDANAPSSFIATCIKSKMQFLDMDVPNNYEKPKDNVSKINTESNSLNTHKKVSGLKF